MVFTDAQTSIDATVIQDKTRLMKNKVKALSNFALFRNRLLILLDERDSPSRINVKSTCQKLDLTLEASLGILDELSEFYLENRQLENARDIVSEMDKLLVEYSSTYVAVHHYLKSQFACNKNTNDIADVLRDRRFEAQEQESTPKGISKTEPKTTGVPTIEQDLWKQLKRIEIPVFSGDKRKYESWKAAFLACVDRAPATGEYKLLQLKQCLSGEALSAIENLGHSAAAYDIAKERLERKFGGKRRQIAIYFEDIERFKQIRPGHAKDLEQFADFLELLEMKLKDTGQHDELGSGSLYRKLQQKLSESMLARYHRWIFEKEKVESVVSLKTWVFQESEFETIASETTYGLTGNSENIRPTQPSPVPTWNSQGTFFGEMIECDRTERISCDVCGEQHTVSNCRKFRNMSVPMRWNTAKRLKLCYRCVASGHRGKSCERSRPCDQGDCQKLHHRLLHRPNRQPKEGTKSKRSDRLFNENNNSRPDVGYRILDCSTADRDFSSTEGKRLDRRPWSKESDTHKMLHNGAEISERMDTEEYKTQRTLMEGNHYA